MTEIFIDVCGADAKKTGQEGILTTGMTGAVIHFRFDSGWDKLTKTAVLRGGGVTRDVLNVGGSVAIPSEVLSQEGLLDIGVEGRSADGSIVIPTVWVHGIFVHAGANASGDPSTDPELPVWAQLQSMIGDLATLDTDAKESLVAAVNEVLSKGSVTAEDVTKAVNEWLAKNPITVTESDPTVPDWAKQPEKPAYTAQEVGAMPAGTAALPNPHALTFSGAAAGSYDGSEAVNIEIPAGGGDASWRLIGEVETTEEASVIAVLSDTPLNEMLVYASVPIIEEDTGGTTYFEPVMWDDARINIYDGPTKPSTYVQRRIYWFHPLGGYVNKWDSAGSATTPAHNSFNETTSKSIVSKMTEGIKFKGFQVRWNLSNKFPAGVILRVMGR